MNLSGPDPQIDLTQRVHMQRFTAEELGTFLMSAAQDPEVECKNVNKWLQAIGATPLREQAQSAGFHQAVEGTLWALPMGQLFWSSLCGRFFVLEALSN